MLKIGYVRSEQMYKSVFFSPICSHTNLQDFIK